MDSMVMISTKAAGVYGEAFGGRAEASLDRLEPVNPAGFPHWNQLCSSHPEGSFFHSVEWMNVLSETYGLNPTCLVAGDRLRPSAVIPLLEVISLGRRKGVSLPFTDYCEPLVWEDSSEAEDLWRQILRYGRSRGWRRLELRGGTALFPCSSPSIEFFGHVLDLSGGEEKAFAGSKPAVRRAIRKAEREGLTVEISTSIEAVKRYYALHCRTRRRHGLPPQPFRLFAKLHEHVISKELGFVVTARRNGTPVAGAVFFRFGCTALFKFGASERQFQHLRANDLVMWSAIRELARQGATNLHFGRTSICNEGLRQFKLGWGTTEHRIQYLTYDFRQSAFTTDRDRTSGWHNRLFGAMPVWVARIAGSLLYKRFA